ncbi:metallophosphoesterase [Streptomyces lasalocidi]
MVGSFTEAIDQVNSLGFRPDFVMHSGDLTHLSTAGQFDQVRQMMTRLYTDRVFTVPGEHDSIGDAGRAYRQTFGKGTLGEGWYSFDTHAVHFIALVNTLSLEKLGHLGTEQIDFVRKDLAGLSSDTPIVVFSHIPLFAMYPQWGWSTDDALKVIALLRRFSSVTCLNGHVHQLFTKTDGNITFHSATTTAYPLPKPGRAPAPTPRSCPPDSSKPRWVFAPWATIRATGNWRSRTRGWPEQDRHNQRSNRPVPARTCPDVRRTGLRACRRLRGGLAHGPPPRLEDPPRRPGSARAAWRSPCVIRRPARHAVVCVVKWCSPRCSRPSGRPSRPGCPASGCAGQR